MARRCRYSGRTRRCCCRGAGACKAPRCLTKRGKQRGTRRVPKLGHNTVQTCRSAHTIEQRNATQTNAGHKMRCCAGGLRKQAVRKGAKCCREAIVPRPYGIWFEAWRNRASRRIETHPHVGSKHTPTSDRKPQKAHTSQHPISMSIVRRMWGGIAVKSERNGPKNDVEVAARW